MNSDSSPSQRPLANRAGSAVRGGGQEGSDRWWLGAIRYGLPATIVIAGLVVMALGSEVELEGGAGLVSAGLAIYFLNWLFRIGVTGDRERRREDAARDYFDRHGRWPQ